VFLLFLNQSLSNPEHKNKLTYLNTPQTTVKKKKGDKKSRCQRCQGHTFRIHNSVCYVPLHAWETFPIFSAFPALLPPKLLRVSSYSFVFDRIEKCALGESNSPECIVSVQWLWRCTRFLLREAISHKLSGHLPETFNFWQDEVWASATGSSPWGHLNLTCNYGS